MFIAYVYGKNYSDPTVEESLTVQLEAKDFSSATDEIYNLLGILVPGQTSHWPDIVPDNIVIHEIKSSHTLDVANQIDGLSRLEAEQEAQAELEREAQYFERERRKQKHKR